MQFAGMGATVRPQAQAQDLSGKQSQVQNVL
jgi:hypothetical protein